MSGKLSEGEAVEAVFSGLAMTGFAMQITKSSRPVSGAEHLFSHIWEMENLEKDGIPVFHGLRSPWEPSRPQASPRKSLRGRPRISM
jgi:glycerol dehydrogenase-like iron-containing ADH family enzyme